MADFDLLVHGKDSCVYIQRKEYTKTRKWKVYKENIWRGYSVRIEKNILTFESLSDITQ